jgi:hypothetical protein
VSGREIFKMNHPYIKFENTKLWQAIDAEIRDLEKNGDLKLATAREYVIGSLCKKIVTQNLALKKSIVKRV